MGAAAITAYTRKHGGDVKATVFSMSSNHPMPAVQDVASYGSIFANPWLRPIGRYNNINNNQCGFADTGLQNTMNVI